MLTYYEKLAEVLVKEKKITHDEIDIYQHGIQAGFEQCLYIMTSIILGIFLNVIVEMIIFLVTFILVRPYVGGIHLKSFIGCYVCSTIISLLAILFSNIYIIHNNICVFIVVLELIIIYIISFRQKYLMETRELEFYKKKLGISLIIIAVSTIIFNLCRNDLYVSVISNTLIIVLISILLQSLKEKYYNIKI